MEITSFELKRIIAETARYAVSDYIQKTGKGNDNISQRKAWLMFGRARVTQWVKAKKITPIFGETETSKIIYSLKELNLLAETDKIINLNKQN